MLISAVAILIGSLMTLSLVYAAVVLSEDPDPAVQPAGRNVGAGHDTEAGPESGKEPGSRA